MIKKLFETNGSNYWIYCHRGFWNSVKEQNSKSAIEKTRLNGLSLEIDLRIHNNNIYISHDQFPISEQNNINNFDLAKIRVAFNLKSDTIYSNKSFIDGFLFSNGSFVFDGSIPEMYKYKSLNIPHALRLSEYERNIAWPVNYIWVDGFNSDWWLDLDNDEIEALTNKSELIIVSPEIHGRPHLDTWNWLLERRKAGNKNLSLCTDFPLELLTLSLES